MQMISLEKDGWKVSRRIGVGDRELVRAGLLQVVLLSKKDTIPQIEACLAAVKKLQKTLRIYINCQRLSYETVQQIISNTFHNYRDHDFMEETNVTQGRFRWVLGRSDISISGLGDPKVLTELVLKLWADTKGRHNLEEKTWRQTEEFCQKTFPEYYAEDENLWELWKAE